MFLSSLLVPLRRGLFPVHRRLSPIRIDPSVWSYPFPPEAHTIRWLDLGPTIKPLLGPVFVENIGGAGASLGAATVARARPDGYTILLGGTLPYVNEALLKARPLYDPNKDLDPIMQLAVGCLAIAVHPSVPAKSLDELVKYTKGNPGKISYGHVGIGSTNHLTGELFKSVAGIPEVVQIPYRGAGPVITDLIGGQIPMGVMAVTPQSLGLHKSGALRILAITSTRPLLAAPTQRLSKPVSTLANPRPMDCLFLPIPREADHRRLPTQRVRC